MGPRPVTPKLDRPTPIEMAAATTAPPTTPPSSPSGAAPGLDFARQRLEELFEHWLGLEETEAKINEWMRKAERGELAAAPAPSLLDLTRDRREGTPPTSPHSPPRESVPSPPPRLSPGSSPTSSRFSSRASSPASTPRGSPLKKRVVTRAPPSPPRAPRIPRLLSARRRGINEGVERAVVELWAQRCASDAMPASDFAAFAAEYCELPTAAGAVLAGRLAERRGDRVVVDRDAWLRHWRDVICREEDPRLRLFAVLAGTRDARGLKPSAFAPVLDCLLAHHPGLAFLSDHAEFQEKYSATVIARVFYRLDAARTGSISRREFIRKGAPCLLEALFRLDADADVNREPSYFSYEHFYVVYCRFWELDVDRDSKLRREDLLRYGGHRLSRAIVDRVFDAAPRAFADGGCGASLRRLHPHDEDADALTYSDFVYLMLAEEDKTNEASLRYWFSCVDLDGDGVIDFRDASFFYDLQSRRMECMGHEAILFKDVRCQMSDMLDVGRGPLKLRIEDFLQDTCPNAGVFFDALFALDKFIRWEQRDPFADRMKRDDHFDTDWDRFAAQEYARMATEEDQLEEAYAESPEGAASPLGSPVEAEVVRSAEAPF